VALTATIFTFDIELADTDRGVYDRRRGARDADRDRAVLSREQARASGLE